jgi:Polypeptide deformylase
VSPCPTTSLYHRDVCTRQHYWSYACCEKGTIDRVCCDTEAVGVVLTSIATTDVSTGTAALNGTEADPKKWLSEVVLVNPTIVEKSATVVSEVEGCLSFPGMNG